MRTLILQPFLGHYLVNPKPFSQVPSKYSAQAIIHHNFLCKKVHTILDKMRYMCCCVYVYVNVFKKNFYYYNASISATIKDREKIITDLKSSEYLEI